MHNDPTIGTMEDVCLVCAEPLVYTAFGPCGHKDACSKCILRLRTVLKDTRCVTCRQTCASVYVTRSMGSYTPTLTADQFAELPVRVGGGVVGGVRDAGERGRRHPAS